MKERLARAYPTDLEIRGGDGRTLCGICAPFGTRTLIGHSLRNGNEVYETIAPGAFARTITERGPSMVKLLAQHDMKSNPIGRATKLIEQAKGLYGEFRVSNTQAGDETLELVRDGSLDGLSIGFEIVRSRESGDSPILVTVEEAKLHEVSVVTWPAYDDARVEAVRSAAPPTPLLSAAQRRAEILRKTPRWIFDRT